MTEVACDILIIGGGPGGLIAAREACSANPNLEVLVLERDRAIGAPVRCGEGVGSEGLREFLDPAGADWIARRISRVIFWAPDGTEVRVAEGDVGYVLDRTRFEPAIAAEAGGAGAHIEVGTEATGLRRAGDRWLVATRGPRGDGVVRACVIIAADGVEGMVARWAGLDTRVPSRDMESCAQYAVRGVRVDPDAIYLHFGHAIAPGGYAWIFPKAPGSANIGLGVVAIHATKGKCARQYLDDYMGTFFPSAIRTGYTVGGVIVHPTITRTVTDGLLVVGDAAHMVNPLSGGGIVNAMKAGRLAARTAVEALAANDTSTTRLQRYHAAWMSLLGDDHLRFYKLKDALSRFDDGFYNSLARTVNGIAHEKRTLRRIFASALVRHPALLPVVAKYFI